MKIQLKYIVPVFGKTKTEDPVQANASPGKLITIQCLCKNLTDLFYRIKIALNIMKESNHERQNKLEPFHPVFFLFADATGLSRTDLRPIKDIDADTFDFFMSSIPPELSHYLSQEKPQMMDPVQKRTGLNNWYLYGNKDLAKKIICSGLEMYGKMMGSAEACNERSEQENHHLIGFKMVELLLIGKTVLGDSNDYFDGSGDSGLINNLVESAVVMPNELIHRLDAVYGRTDNIPNEITSQALGDFIDFYSGEVEEQDIQGPVTSWQAKPR